MIFKTEKNLISYGEQLGNDLRRQLKQNDSPIVIELIGDVGAGKTTFTGSIAKGLGVKSPVTSPSFTISKQYTFPIDNNTSGTLVHYDFYRLDDPGIMVEDFAESISQKHTRTIIEWGQSVQNLLPEDHISYTICINDDNSREVK